MQLVTEAHMFAARGASYPVHVVRPAPATEPLPQILLLHEVWGVDPHMHDVAGRFAAAGYEVWAPDLWSPGGVRPEALTAARMQEARDFLVGLGPGQWNHDAGRASAIEREPEPSRSRLRQTLALMFGRDLHERTRFFDDHEAVVNAAHAHMRAARPDLPIAVVGFCMGGGFAARLACSTTDLGAAVIFYGPPPPPERLAAIGCPVLGLYGDRDRWVNQDLPAFFATLGALGKVAEQVVFSGVRHAFFNDTGRGYDARAARRAWARTLAFLAQTIGG